MATTGNANLGDYLELDDTQLWVSLAAWQKTKDSVLSDLSRRLYRRELFKTYELYGEQAEARDLVLARAREVAVEAKLDPMVYVGLDSASFAPFDDSDEPLMVVFPGDVTRRPAEVSFLLARLRGERLERVRLIFAPELRDQVLSAVEV
jgi:hypothetical protein